MMKTYSAWVALAMIFFTSTAENQDKAKGSQEGFSWLGAWDLDDTITLPFTNKPIKLRGTANCKAMSPLSMRCSFKRGIPEFNALIEEEAYFASEPGTNKATLVTTLSVVSRNVHTSTIGQDGAVTFEPDIYRLGSLEMRKETFFNLVNASTGKFRLELSASDGSWEVVLDDIMKRRDSLAQKNSAEMNLAGEWDIYNTIKLPFSKELVKLKGTANCDIISPTIQHCTFNRDIPELNLSVEEDGYIVVEPGTNKATSFTVVRLVSRHFHTCTINQDGVGSCDPVIYRIGSVEIREDIFFGSLNANTGTFRQEFSSTDGQWKVIDEQVARRR